MTVVTRFPPSPTGYLHIGGARTALFSWLYARKHGGYCVLRIEDTDRERSTQESVQAIFDSLEWLGLEFGEGPYFQTKRIDRYKEVIQDMLGAGSAYYCYCSKEVLQEMRDQQRADGKKPRYDGRCRHRTEPESGVNPVIRFMNPTEGDVVIDDQIKGKIIISNTELDDLIIARSDGMPTYNFTVVVDDMDMGITHVIRGDDHVNNTPRQINILKALGAALPSYAHVPMILGADGKRMSKRHGAVGVIQYKEKGYLPHALLNYLARLGWSHGDQEIFSMQQMIDLFEIEDVHRNPAVFDPEKLLWVNYEYMKSISLEELKEHAREHFTLAGVDIDDLQNWKEVLRVNQERSKTIVELVDRSLFFFKELDGYDEKAVNKNFKDQARDILKQLVDELSKLDDWGAQDIHGCVHYVAEENRVGLGKVAQPIRVAVAGVAVSPPIDETLAILGKDKTLNRLRAAISFIDSNV